jgi:crotonobetainyl-CoA:carnitine CoA-transferase CaiB-like acyl-CoA transferase
LIAEVERALETGPAEEWIGRLEEAGIPAGKVRTMDEVYGWEQS